MNLWVFFDIFFSLFFLLIIPLLLIGLGIFFLVKSRRLRKKEAAEPGTVPQTAIKRRKIAGILMLVIGCVLFAVTVGFDILLTVALAHM